MRKLCPNIDREDGLETVLEVPVPEEAFASRSDKPRRAAAAAASWMRPQPETTAPSSALGRNAELQLLLGVIAAPLVPLPVTADRSFGNGAGKAAEPFETSMAKYIVKQYIAASGGDAALDAIGSMYAMGKVRLTASEFRTEADAARLNKCIGGAKKSGRSNAGGRAEMGGFVLWQKKPDLWCLELVVSGCKISAGSDGKVAWRQTPWHQSHASRGPPRPLRRTLQGLDPRSTANMFSNATCVGEKAVNGDDCFILRREADAAALRARSSSSVEIIRHTVWGYFSHRTGLLVQLKDTHLLQIKGGAAAGDNVLWETTMESLIKDYRPVDGVYIAHSGRTAVSLFRIGDRAEGRTRTSMEESWTVEEVDFNIVGLSAECFLPPGDLKKEACDVDLPVKSARLSCRVASSTVVDRVGVSQVAAVESEESSTEGEEGGLP